MQGLYGCEAVESLIQHYAEKGGECVTISEGTLGYGDMILWGEKLKTTIIHEVYLNEWSSAHTIRMYNKMPKKYEKIIDEFYEKDEREYDAELKAGKQEE